MVSSFQNNGRAFLEAEPVLELFESFHEEWGGGEKSRIDM